MIDFHFHAPVKEFLNYLGEFAESTLKYFNAKVELKDLGNVLDEFGSLGVENFVILPIDSTTFLGRKIPNELVCSIRDDRIVKFVSVDPLKDNSKRV